MVYLAPPSRWKLWPGWGFFIEPSGGHPPPWSLWTRLTEGPLVGHAFGSFLAWGAGRLIWRFVVTPTASRLTEAFTLQLDGWSMWWWIVFLQFAWQANAIHRRVYSPETAIGQATWRILIGAVAGALMVWLL